MNALYNTSCGMAKAGEADLALLLLAQVMANIGIEGLLWIREDSDWADFRSDPRWLAIMDQAEQRLTAEGRRADRVTMATTVGEA